MIIFHTLRIYKFTRIANDRFVGSAALVQLTDKEEVTVCACTAKGEESIF